MGTELSLAAASTATPGCASAGAFVDFVLAKLWDILALVPIGPKKIVGHELIGREQVSLEQCTLSEVLV